MIASCATVDTHIDDKASVPSEASEEPSVRRGRWRKALSVTVQQEHGRVSHSPESGNSAPSMSDTKENANLDYDSLDDCLHERKAQSSPAIDTNIDDFISWDVGIDTGLTLDDGVLKTPSTFGDIDSPFSMLENQPPGKCFDFSGFVPSSPTHTQLSCHETIWGSSSASCGEMLDSAMCIDQLQCCDDRLQFLRMRGTAIQQQLAETRTDDLEVQAQGQPTFEVSESMVVMLGPSVHWHTAACMPDSTRYVMESSPDSSVIHQWQQLQQPQFFPLPPSSPPAIDASRMTQSPMPPPPPPPPPLSEAPQAPAVLRLADSLLTPELGTLTSPSIGSLLHHRGDCKPCSFFHTTGCENREACQFCHLCGPGEKKRRVRAHRTAKRGAKLAALLSAKAELDSFGNNSTSDGSAKADF